MWTGCSKPHEQLSANEDTPSQGAEKPSIRTADDGDYLTFRAGTCFRPRDFGRYIKAKGSIEVKQIFKGEGDFETKLERITQERPAIQEISSALFDVCLDYVNGRITKEEYGESRKLYERAKAGIFNVKPEVKPVARSADVTSGQVNFGCEETLNIETPVVPFGANPQNVSPQALWKNMDHVKSYKANPVEVHDPKDNRLTGIKAVGPITGVDKETMFKNCPGGGHGELTLHVTWTEDQPVAK
jgi:hypothetical protein